MNFLRSLLAAPALAGVFVCAALVGCATPQVAQLQSHRLESIAPRTAPLPVKFIPQEDFECGPAALAMALQYAGLPVSAEDLVPQVYLPGRKGSLQTEMLTATRRNGLLPYPLAPRIETLLQEVAAGHPVIVFQNVSLPIYPVWHYAVVVGYDLDRNVITLHSGRTERMEMSLFTFERTWERGAYWSMVALQPSMLPATAEPEPLARAAAALEPVNAAAARSSYQTALQKWPNHRALLLGLGNTAYAQHDLPGAASAYRQAVDADPAFADGWNNLAQVLFEQGKRQDALGAIDQAIRLGGPRVAQYQTLRQEIGAP